MPLIDDLLGGLSTLQAVPGLASLVGAGAGGLRERRSARRQRKELTGLTESLAATAGGRNRRRSIAQGLGTGGASQFAAESSIGNLLQQFAPTLMGLREQEQNAVPGALLNQANSLSGLVQSTALAAGTGGLSSGFSGGQSVLPVPGQEGLPSQSGLSQMRPEDIIGQLSPDQRMQLLRLLQSS